MTTLDATTLTGTNSFKTLMKIVQSRGIKEDDAPEACPVCGGTGYVVKRNAKGYVVSAECTACRSVQKNRVQWLIHVANMPSVKLTTVPNVKSLNYIKDFTSDRPNWMLLSGKTGGGKTTEAVWIAKKLIQEKNVYTRFYNAYDLTRQLIATKRRMNEHDELIDEIKTLDLLILDDFLKTTPVQGSFNYAEFVEATLEIVWTRYDVRKPLIITTQLSLEALTKFDSALAGRIVELSQDYVVIFDNTAKNWRMRK